MTVKPFSSMGEEMAFNLNHSQKEIIGTICPRPENRENEAIIEFYNGDVKIIQWKEITFMRCLNPWEK
ncbi:hypothetical protein AB3N02_22175 [Priestia aryabhattai]|uniref:hypothetical protein n=1 Tax=Priestia aryabhattai TaxID=412384 RepID=UPI00399F445F